jgi:hypothetical protein
VAGVTTIEFWARIRGSTDAPLRRGGWYRVVSYTPLEAVLDVEGGEPVSVPRPYLDIRAARPEQWTVVRNPTVAARAPEIFRKGYIVCPECQNRVPLPASQVASQLCPRCNGTFPIAWDEPYLEVNREGIAR